MIQYSAKTLGNTFVYVLSYCAQDTEKTSTSTRAPSSQVHYRKTDVLVKYIDVQDNFKKATSINQALR